MNFIWNKSLFFFLHEVVFDFLFYLWNIFQFVDLRIKSAFSSTLAFQEITKPEENKKWSFVEILELTQMMVIVIIIFFANDTLKNLQFPNGLNKIRRSVNNKLSRASLLLVTHCDDAQQLLGDHYDGDDDDDDEEDQD